MKELTLAEIKNSQLNTLIIFSEFCKKNNLKYYLACGTLLGAVRHKGFIPWDDDIDIYMPRDDYDFLIKHFNEKINSNRRVISKEIKPDFYCNFAKIIDANTIAQEKDKDFKIGVWIDIFPMENIIEDRKKLVALNIIITLLNFLLQYSLLKPEKRRVFYKNFLIKIYNILFPNELLLKKKEKYITKIVAKTKTNYYGLLYKYFGIFGIPIASTSMFEPSIKLEFEGKKFDAPKEYDKILKSFYGKDYMVLPPAQKQISNHNYICYWKENENK